MNADAILIPAANAGQQEVAEMVRKKPDAIDPDDTVVLPVFGRVKWTWIDRATRVRPGTALVASALVLAVMFGNWSAPIAKSHFDSAEQNARDESRARQEESKARALREIATAEQQKELTSALKVALSSLEKESGQNREAIIQVTMTLKGLTDEIRELKRNKQ
jgi:septal ring factor EnvC (AmiA/AmiB activator)